MARDAAGGVGGAENRMALSGEALSAHHWSTWLTQTGVQSNGVRLILCI
jgi:hypothetical protein